MTSAPPFPGPDNFVCTVGTNRNPPPVLASAFTLFGSPQDYFARLPELRVVEYTPVAVRVYGDFAVQAGTYTFAFQGPDGATVEKRARFSFTFRRDRPGSPQPWTIVEHHSSSMPTAPAGLKHVRDRHTKSC